MKTYDFVGIGDVTTDAFIKLSDADTHTDHGTRELCVRFGDKIPYESVDIVRAVGNSPNAAVSASRLGLMSALVANVGDDENGRECLESLEQNNVSTEFVAIHHGIPTNYHYVLCYGAERTILIKHELYDYFLPEIRDPKWIYLSSLASNSESFHKELANYLQEHARIKLAFQPGTFQMKLGYEKLKEIYKRTEIFFCNKEEAMRILDTANNDIKQLLKHMHALGPQIVCITDGTGGAYAFDGEHAWKMPMYPDPKPPVQRTGAGDAFSSTFTAAIILGNGVPEALSWGPINAMSVVQQVGAQKGLLSQDALLKFLREAPKTYTPTQLF